MRYLNPSRGYPVWMHSVALHASLESSMVRFLKPQWSSIAFVYCYALQTFFSTSMATITASKWHLQRIVQREKLNDSQLSSGKQIFDLNSIPVAPVNVYIIDSGIQIDHHEFKDNRASYGVNIINQVSLPTDCDGHGTHVASLAVGAYSGVAKKARAIAVRILDCSGRGSCSDMLSALEWIILDSKKRQKNGERSVAVMSIGSANEKCAATIEATQLLWDSGIIMTAAAGNNNSDACKMYPARNPRTITVGATDKYDRIYKKNNYGDCIDIFGPGVRVFGASGAGSDDEWKALSGSSMAAPIVAGTAALILGADPKFSAADVREILISSSSRNRILAVTGNNVVTNSVNRLLFAPWSRLFDKVAMNSLQEISIPPKTFKRESQLQDSYWNDSASFVSLSMTLSPKMRPAMHYSVIRITIALSDVAGLRPASILVRRANGVKASKDGQEPSSIALVFYIPMLPNLVREYRRRLVNADRLGKLFQLSSEQFSFAQGSLGNAFLINVTVPEAEKTEGPTEDGDRSNEHSGSEISESLKISLIVIASVIVLAALVAFAVLYAIPKIVASRERRAAVALARSNTIVMGLGEGTAPISAVL